MFDTSEDRSDRHSEKEDRESVCRDFVRGSCDRKHCKYRHEVEMKQLNFCHDFQNNICPRNNCKFIHCTPEEEIEYKSTGIMSNHILVEATRKNQLPGAMPICNQFRKGLCRRSYCKYRHLTREEEEAEILGLIQNNSKKNGMMCIGSNPLAESQMMNTSNPLHRRTLIGFDEFEECGIQLPKRRFISPPEPEIIATGELHPVDSNRMRPIFKGYFAANPPPPILSRADARTLMLEEENDLLHKELVQLKRQVSDLTATNEFLLDQNANLRVSGKRNDTVTMPAVTITNTSTPQVIRTVTASVATVPVSLATVSTCNPVSVSIASCPTMSMTPATQILAPSQQILVTTNPPPQMAIASSSQAQLAMAAQQSLANNLAAAQQGQQQLTSQGQPIALATTTQLTLANNPQQQQLTSQGQQLTSQAQQMAPTQLSITTMPQQLLTQQGQQIELHRSNNPQQQQLTSQGQQLTLTNPPPQLTLTNPPPQLTLTNPPPQLTLTNPPPQLTLTNPPPQLTSQGQQLAPTQLSITTMPQQLLAQQTQQIELHRNAMNTSQAINMSNANQPMVSYPIMTQAISHALTH